MTPVQHKQLCSELDAIYQQDEYEWMVGQVFTQDETTQRKMPYPDKAYVRDLIYVLQTEKGVILPKSRRVLASWTACAHCVYKTRYYPYNAAFIQSKTEDNASYLVEKRCKYMEDNLREPGLRRRYKAIRTHKGTVGRITYDGTQSYIWALAQGGDIIRTFTFSILFMDESEFQPEGFDAFSAALPTWEKGAQIILASSSNGPMGVIAGLCKEIGFVKFK